MKYENIKTLLLICLLEAAPLILINSLHYISHLITHATKENCSENVPLDPSWLPAGCAISSNYQRFSHQGHENVLKIEDPIIKLTAVDLTSHRFFPVEYKHDSSEPNFIFLWTYFPNLVQLYIDLMTCRLCTYCFNIIYSF